MSGCVGSSVASARPLAVGHHLEHSEAHRPSLKPFILGIDPRSMPIQARPTFHESIWNLLPFLVLIVLFRLGSQGRIRLPSGALSCVYLLGYSLGRVWIEGLRIDPLCIGALPPACEGGLRIAQLMSGLLMMAGAIGLAWLYSRSRSHGDPSQAGPSGSHG